MGTARERSTNKIALKNSTQMLANMCVCSQSVKTFLNILNTFYFMAAQWLCLK